MIIVDITLDEYNVIKKVHAYGHSGYADKGTDIVCASVSAFVESAYIFLQNVEGNVVVPIQDKNDETGNDLEYRLDRYESELHRELQGMTMFLLTGLEILGRNYKDYLKLNIK